MYTVEDIKTLAGVLYNVRKDIVDSYDFNMSRERKIDAYDRLIKIDRLIDSCAKFMYAQIYTEEEE